MTTDTITIIIVDDHPMVREGLRSMLTADDVEIIGEAGTGREALALATRLQPDVALMDIRMPDVDGIEALDAFREKRLPTRVIMVTTYRNTTYLLRALAAGAAGFVLKDISRDELLATVRDVAHGVSRVDYDFLQSVLRNLNAANSVHAGPAIELVEPLTPRETDVLQLLVEGLTNQAIGQVLGVSSGTVKGYVQNILRKLDAADRTQAAVKAIRSGLVN